ncbi:MAG: sulfur oxidation c-type cytochrome SoxX [Rubrivivax sp.]
MNMKHLVWAAAAACTLIAACASQQPSSQKLDEMTLQVMKDSFSDKGIATVARLDQDLGQSACSSAEPPSDAVAQKVMAEARASIKPPAGGQYFGDWKAGEKLAQNGRGMTWNDKSADPATNGGNCYNCHQISKAEISYGTIGPTLYQYGKTRGVTDLASPNSQAIVEYTWAKLYNSKTYNACSNMPRFGEKHLLNEAQMRDLMSLLLDPKSPVNAQ